MEQVVEHGGTFWVVPFTFSDPAAPSLSGTGCRAMEVDGVGWLKFRSGLHDIGRGEKFSVWQCVGVCG